MLPTAKASPRLSRGYGDRLSSREGSGEAARRWRSLVRARRAEIERLTAGDEGAGRRADRARGAAARRERSAGDDPFLRRLRRVTGSRTSVIDVGSGAGRFALPLAPRVAEVVAVDPDPAALARLAEGARRAGLGNVRTVEGRWEDVDVAPADVAFASYVLPIVDDAPRFVAKLDSAARRHALLYLGAFTFDAVVDPLWRYFHGRPRAPGPTWLDAAAVLAEMGIDARIEVVEVPHRARFPSMDEAVGDYLDLLALPDGPPARAELRRLLGDWLVGPPTALRPPIATLPAAVVSWRPG